jgi:hypothetical protein
VALNISTLTDREERQTFAVGKPAPMEHFDSRRHRTSGRDFDWNGRPPAGTRERFRRVHAQRWQRVYGRAANQGKAARPVSDNGDARSRFLGEESESVRVRHESKQRVANAAEGKMKTDFRNIAQ